MCLNVKHKEIGYDTIRKDKRVFILMAGPTKYRVVHKPCRRWNVNYVFLS